MARISGLVAGHLTAPAAMWRAGDPPDVFVTIPVPVYLVEADGHRVLIDTGLHPRAGVERYGPAAQAVGWAPPPAPPDVDPTLIVLTHLHFDHAGNVGAFPGVPVVLQSAEWEAGRNADDSGIGYAPVDYEALSPRLVDGTVDLLGEGSIMLHPTIGHTPGHQSVVVRLDDGRRVVIAGDACYFPENLDTEVSPPYGWDKPKELASLRWLRDRRDAGDIVLCGHDPNAGTFCG